MSRRGAVVRSGREVTVRSGRLVTERSGREVTERSGRNVTERSGRGSSAHRRDPSRFPSRKAKREERAANNRACSGGTTVVATESRGNEGRNARGQEVAGRGASRCCSAFRILGFVRNAWVNIYMPMGVVARLFSSRKFILLRRIKAQQAQSVSPRRAARALFRTPLAIRTKCSTKKNRPRITPVRGLLVLGSEPEAPCVSPPRR